LRNSDLQDEAALLYRFVGEVRSALERARADGKFPQWADAFLDHSLRAAEQTQEEVLADIRRAAEHPERSEAYRTKVAVLTKAWRALHDYVKPIVDATSLRVPYPLVNFLDQQIRRLPELSDVRIIVGVTPRLNYYQHRHTHVRGLVEDLKEAVSGCPDFGQVGFVSLPFSQPQSLFMNCLLYHEAGHFIFEERQLVDDVLPSIAEEVSREIATPNRGVRTWLQRCVVHWLEEVFADVTATKLLGPSYLVAYAVMTRLMRGSEWESSRAFTSEYPPDGLRIREQLKALVDDNWSLECLEKTGTLEFREEKDEDFTPPAGELSSLFRPLTRILFNQCGRVHELADHALEGRDKPQEVHHQCDKDVTQSLAHGIIPSTLAGADSPCCPHPSAVINSAVFYWLDGMGGLFDIVEDLDRENVADRVYLQGRLEMWALKAVEDWLITEKRREKGYLQWPS